MIDEALIELLRPVIREVVREEMRHAKLELRWVPVKKAAAIFGISENALRQRVLAGSVPGKRVDGRVYVDMLAHDARVGQLP